MLFWQGTPDFWQGSHSWGAYVQNMMNGTCGVTWTDAQHRCCLADGMQHCSATLWHHDDKVNRIGDDADCPDITSFNDHQKGCFACQMMLPRIPNFFGNDNRWVNYPIQISRVHFFPTCGADGVINCDTRLPHQQDLRISTKCSQMNQRLDLVKQMQVPKDSLHDHGSGLQQPVSPAVQRNKECPRRGSRQSS